MQLTAAVSLPNPASSAKLTADYSSEALSIKSTVGLNASPVVDVALVGVRGLALGWGLGWNRVAHDMLGLDLHGRPCDIVSCTAGTLRAHKGSQAAGELDALRSGQASSACRGC